MIGPLVMSAVEVYFTVGVIAVIVLTFVAASAS